MTLCGISSRFQLLSPTERQVSHALLTRSPLSYLPKEITPFDLHVLGTPPAFVLSQDQTLKKLYLNSRRSSNQSFEQFASSKITQEFSLAVNSISRNLNKSINLSKVLISSSSRYSIYKVQWSFRLTFVRLELFYSITTSSVCQALFSKFFNFLKAAWQSSLSRSATAFAAAFRLYHISNRLSRPFFEAFQLLKSSFPNRLSIRFNPPLLSEQLV